MGSNPLHGKRLRDIKISKYSNINARTVVAPLVAFTMAALLFVYTRSSIYAAKRKAQNHRIADGVSNPLKQMYLVPAKSKGSVVPSSGRFSGTLLRESCSRAILTRTRARFRGGMKVNEGTACWRSRKTLLVSGA